MKREIREKIIKNRNNLTKEEINNKSYAIFKKLSQTDLYKNAKKIMLFISFNNEVLTKPIIDNSIKHEKQVFIPVTVPKTKEIIVSELLNFEEDLEVGTFGLLEPKKDFLRPYSPEQLDLIIVPGVAFDSRGYRIGYGAGYYDRFLAKIDNDVPKISLAFDMQIINHVPNEEYDIPVDYIITESNFIECKRVIGV